MKLTFINRRQESDGVYVYSFSPDIPVSWRAGQSIRLELPRKPFGSHERRFTIVSAPHKNQISIATRHSTSDFKTTLTNLRAGDKIDGFSIEGTFLWEESNPSDSPHILVAGGIGITPYIAMLEDRVHHNSPLNAHVLYSNRSSDIPFANVLDLFAQTHPEFHIQYFVNKRITAEDIKTLVYHVDSKVYISGSTAMTKNLSAQLVAQGIAKQNIRLDQFSGLQE